MSFVSFSQEEGAPKILIPFQMIFQSIYTATIAVAIISNLVKKKRWRAIPPLLRPHSLKPHQR